MNGFLNERMPFGKHIGRRLADIPARYLRWLLAEADNLDWHLRRAIQETLRAHDEALPGQAIP